MHRSNPGVRAWPEPQRLPACEPKVAHHPDAVRVASGSAQGSRSTVGVLEGVRVKRATEEKLQEEGLPLRAA